MTNKPMLSVELRELLVRINNLHATGNDIDIEMKELRALLDKPAEPSRFVGAAQYWSENEQALRDVCKFEGLKGLVYQVVRDRDRPAGQHQGEPVACMPVDRCYDVRAKMIIAFNEAKKAGGDLDDALDAAYKSALRYSPNPMTFEQPAPVVTVAKLTQAVHDVAGFPGVTGYQLRELADRLNGGKP